MLTTFYFLTSNGVAVVLQEQNLNSWIYKRANFISSIVTIKIHAIYVHKNVNKSNLYTGKKSTISAEIHEM
jgi:hypothetical protein